jgi:hypothetical protein
VDRLDLCPGGGVDDGVQVPGAGDPVTVETDGVNDAEVRDLLRVLLRGLLWGDRHVFSSSGVVSGSSRRTGGAGYAVSGRFLT